MAAEKGRLDVLKVLVENGGDVNERLQPDAGFFIQKGLICPSTQNRYHDLSFGTPIVHLLRQDIGLKGEIRAAVSFGDKKY